MLTAHYHGLDESEQPDLEKAYFWCLVASYEKATTQFALHEKLAALPISDPNEKAIIELVKGLEKVSPDDNEDRQKMVIQEYCYSFKSQLNPMVASDVIEATQRWQPESQQTPLY